MCVSSNIECLPYKKKFFQFQVVAHSVGTWCAYELLVLARARGLPLPRHAFLSGMAAPDIPAAERPWRRQAGLTEAAFRVIFDSLIFWNCIRLEWIIYERLSYLEGFKGMNPHLKHP